MQTTIISILAVIFLIIMYIVFSLFTMTLNDLMEKTIKKTLWIWLPFHAFNRLTREFREKYMK